MGQACAVCGKKPVIGNQVTTRGRAKYLGGVGVKTTGISRRQFKPNLRTVRVSTPNGQHMTIRVCARCLRSGMVTKTVHQEPFKLPTTHPEKGKHALTEEGQAQKAVQQAAAQGPPAEYKPPEGLKIRKRKRDKSKEETPEQPEEPKE